MKRLFLGRTLFDCPKYWIKFVDTYNPMGESPDRMHYVLKKEYRAKIDSDVWYVEFDKESDYVMFLLHWS